MQKTLKIVVAGDEYSVQISMYGTGDDCLTLQGVPALATLDAHKQLLHVMQKWGDVDLLEVLPTRPDTFVCKFAASLRKELPELPPQRWPRCRSVFDEYTQQYHARRPDLHEYEQQLNLAIAEYDARRKLHRTIQEPDSDGWTLVSHRSSGAATGADSQPAKEPQLHQNFYRFQTRKARNREQRTYAQMARRKRERDEEQQSD